MSNSCDLKIVALQPGYLPWLGFFNQLFHSDVFVFYDDVQFDKHGWRNRNRIKSPIAPHWLTVPVFHKGQGKPHIIEIEIREILHIDFFTFIGICVENQFFTVQKC